MVQNKAEVLPQGVSSQRVRLEWGVLPGSPERRELIFRHLYAPGASVYIIAFE